MASAWGSHLFIENDYMPENIFFIGNRSSEFLINHLKTLNIPTLLSEEELHRALAGRKQLKSPQLKGIVVELDLNWKKDQDAQHQACEVLRRLRVKEKLACPFLLLCHLPAAELSTLYKHLHYLRDPAIALLPTLDLLDMKRPAIEARLPEPLDEQLYEDLATSLYDPLGYLEEVVHDLFGDIRRVRSEQVSSEQAKEILEHHATDLIKLFPEEAEQVNSRVEQCKRKIDEAPQYYKARLNRIIADFYSDFKDFAMKRLAGNALAVEERGAKILYIDDEADYRKMLTERLEKHQIECIAVANGQEALEVLAADEKTNSITVVVCDFRFVEPDGKYSRQQVYHILGKIAETRNMVSMMTLTGMSTDSQARFSMLIRKRVIPYFKKSVFDDYGDGLLHFCYTLIEEDRRIKEEIVNLPKFGKEGRWFYKMHREATDYEAEEKRISETAMGFVQAVIAVKYGGNGQDINYRLDLNIKGKLNTRDPQNNLSNFREKLLGRRIALGLCQLGLERDNRRNWLYIYEIMRFRSIRQSKDEKGMMDWINRELKLSLRKNYPYESSDNQSLKLTFEERRWLQRDWEALFKAFVG
ncbi:MAG: hypothetical protein AAGG75_09850 [Bacteroidota bacterium]